jgi:3-dehydroquinate dehydratase-2
VLSGPNLQLLGTREPEIYGKETLADIHARLADRAKELGVAVEAFQSNHEGALLDRIGAARGAFEGLLLNGGALTHTSLALFDAKVSGFGGDSYLLALEGLVRWLGRRPAR